MEGPLFCVHQISCFFFSSLLKLPVCCFLPKSILRFSTLHGFGQGKSFQASRKKVYGCHRSNGGAGGSNAGGNIDATKCFLVLGFLGLSFCMGWLIWENPI